jgi:hypothetical protein
MAFNPYMTVTPQSVVVFEVVVLPASLSQLVELDEVAQHNAQRRQLLVKAAVNSFLLCRSHIKVDEALRQLFVGLS